MNIAVIGGTSGIGEGLSHALLDGGFTPIVGGRRTVQWQSIKSIELDVTVEESVSNFFDKINDLEGLVYCAGITTPHKSITDFDQNEFTNIVNTNVRGLLLCLKYAYPKIKKSQLKSIVIVNSVAARSYSQFSSVSYTASKAALSGIVRQLSQEFASDNIRINSVFPSMTRTPMLSNALSQDKIESIGKNIPLNRIAEINDVTNAIQFLLSEKSSYITGSGIDINGGSFVNG